MQAHTLGEVGILGIVLLRVSSGTILAIFIEIGSYLTEGAKNKLAQFFRHGVHSIFGSGSTHLIVLVLLVRRMLLKSLRLHCFKSDRDEIWDN